MSDEKQEAEESGTRLKVTYTYMGDILKIKTSSGGAKIAISLDYSDEEAGSNADMLVASIPGIVENVLADLAAKSEASDG